MAQPVKPLTLDFGSGHDLGVVRSSPMSGHVLGMDPAWDFLSLPLCPFPTTPKEGEGRE